MLQWFRLHHEFSSDPKIQSMSEANQRRLIMLFCLQCKGELQNLNKEEIANYLRIDNETFHETVALFQQKGFIDKNMVITNWNKRQYSSDNSTERVKKYREKTTTKKNETFQKRCSNGDVTPPDTDNRLQITDNNTLISPKKEKPKHEFVLPEWINAETWDAFMEVRKKKKAANTPRALTMLVRELEKMKAAGESPDKVIEQSIMRSWIGVFSTKHRDDKFAPKKLDTSTIDEHEKARQLAAMRANPKLRDRFENDSGKVRFMQEYERKHGEIA